MTKKEFRAIVVDRLLNSGVKKINKDRLRRAVNRTNTLIRDSQGEIKWTRRSANVAVNLYSKNK